MEQTLDLPQGLINFIQSLVEKGSFASVEAFLDYAAHVIADLYGFSESAGGKSLTSALASVLPTAPAARGAATGPSPEEEAVIDAFTSKLELEEALYMNHVMLQMQAGQRPMEKADFTAIVETLISRGTIQKLEQAEKIYLKLLD
ncbi:MAG: hypothetical protein ACFFGZ_15270 [Candidatus Thorarchaeota archaeon]